jgi:hypothetical protein
MLPPIEQCRSECDRCFVKETCMTINAALEGGTGRITDEGIAGLSREVTSHLTPPLVAELAKWLKLVDAEAAATMARRATPWMPVADVRRRKGFAMDGFTLRHVPRDENDNVGGGASGGSGGGGGGGGNDHVMDHGSSGSNGAGGSGNGGNDAADNGVNNGVNGNKGGNGSGNDSSNINYRYVMELSSAIASTSGPRLGSGPHEGGESDDPARANDRRLPGDDAAHPSQGPNDPHAMAGALRTGERLVLSRQGGEIVVSRIVLRSVSECVGGGGREATGAPDARPAPAGAGAGSGVASGVSGAAMAPGGVRLEIEMERPVRMHGPGAATPNELWRIDRDDGGATMSGRLRSSVVTAFSSQAPRALALRRRIFALDPPVFNRAGAEAAMASLSHGAAAAVAVLNAEQRSAVTHILAAQDYALVRGLPGAGKSATLAAVVRVLTDCGRSVLITANTHSAVDNILQRLPAVGVDGFVRVGGEEGKASPAVAPYCPGGERHAAKTTAQLSLLANSARVVGGTCYAVANNPVIVRRESRGKGKGADGHFDVVLVDEAGQMTLPASLAPLLRGAIFVLVDTLHP